MVKNLTLKEGLTVLLLIIFAGLLGGVMAFYMIGMTLPKTGTIVTEKVTEKQVYLESSQTITAAQVAKQSVVSILGKEDLEKIAVRSGEFEQTCLNGEINCSRLAIVLTSDGVVISAADLAGRDLAEWIAVDQQNNQYQLLKIGQLNGANLYQMVKKGELALLPAERTKFFNLKPVLLANLDLLQSGQKVLGLKSVYLDLVKSMEGYISAKSSVKQYFQNIDTKYSTVALRFGQDLDGQVLFDLSGQLIAVRLISGDEVLADQIAAFLKRYSVNPQAFGMADFGLKCLDIDKKMAVLNGIGIDYGCLVAEGMSVDGKVISGGVKKSSLAEKAGLRPGDVILEVDNKSLVNNGLGWAIMNKATGERMDLVVFRDGKAVQLVASF